MDNRACDPTHRGGQGPEQQELTPEAGHVRVLWTVLEERQQDEEAGKGKACESISRRRQDERTDSGRDADQEKAHSGREYAAR